MIPRIAHGKTITTSPLLKYAVIIHYTTPEIQLNLV